MLSNGDYINDKLDSLSPVTVGDMEVTNGAVLEVEPSWLINLSSQASSLFSKNVSCRKFCVPFDFYHVDD